jgi:protein gp37
MLWKGALRVFVNSLSDLFHAAVPFEFVDEVINVIKRCPQHQFQVLTKRPSRMAEFLSRLNDPVIPNLWVGVSVEDQRSANERISELVKVPAAVRFVSIEPLLGPVDLSMIPNPGFGEGQSWYDALKRLAWVADPSGYYDGCSVGVGLDWVIVGGESGPKARECDIAWIKSVVTQCRESGVACFVKQDSGPHSGLQGRIPNDLWRVRQFPSGE